MDDVSYFPEDPSQVQGEEYYHAESKQKVDFTLTVKHREKYPRRYLVWQAIGEDGHRSKPFISFGQTINAEIYLKHCIQERLIPFINQYHKKDEVLFWPDLATCHYHRDVQQFLQESGIEVVKKDKNPPNLPQARPIERYWALVKRQYKRRQKAPKSLTSFKRMYKNDSSKVLQSTVRSLMAGIRQKLRCVAHRGLYSVY